MSNSTKVTDNPYGERFAAMREHFHWDPYDMKLEGCRFNMLHNLLTQPAESRRDERIAGVRTDLVALAESKGYGEQDSYLYSDRDHPLFEEKSLTDVLDEQYDEMIEHSVNVLLALPNVDNTLITSLAQEMRDAVVAGRTLRGESETSPQHPYR